MHLKELELLYKGPKHILKLTNLTQLYINSCPKLRYIFTLTVAQDLLQLTQLRIRDCEDLEQIIVQDDEENEIQQEFFPKLLQIDVKECNKLRSLFPITIAKAKGLQQLKDILVERCSQLEEVFGDKDEAHSMDDQKIVLPQVENLFLTELPNLTNFCPLDYHVMISELKFLEIGGCQQQLWDRIVLACLRYGSKNLENLIIRNCGVKMLFQLEELPNLKELKLESLKEIEGLTHISLQNLTKLYVNGCHKLTHIFSCTLAQNMSQLKELYIRDCEELKQIIFEGDEEDQNLLQKLSYIYVRGCHKLKHLFPLTIVRGMKELQDIRITDNSALDQVFGDKGGNDKEIELRQLSYLVLAALPTLANFCPVGYRFKFPSLEQLGVWECPMIATKFSFAQDKSFHVEAKVELPP